MVFGGDILTHVHGGGVEHGDQLHHVARGEKSDSVGHPLLRVEGETSGHIELPVEDDPLVILVDDDPHLLPFLVLGRNIYIVLLPVYVHLELYFVVELRFEDEVIETAADEGVGADVCVCHVVLGPDLLLFALDQFGLGCVTALLLCSWATTDSTRHPIAKILIILWIVYNHTTFRKENTTSRLPLLPCPKSMFKTQPLEEDDVGRWRFKNLNLI